MERGGANKWSVKCECDQKSNGRGSEALSGVCAGLFCCCSIASIGPLSEVTQACRTVPSWHQFLHQLQ